MYYRRPRKYWWEIFGYKTLGRLFSRNRRKVLQSRKYQKQRLILANAAHKRSWDRYQAEKRAKR